MAGFGNSYQTVVEPLVVWRLIGVKKSKIGFELSEKIDHGEFSPEKISQLLMLVLYRCRFLQYCTCHIPMVLPKFSTTFGREDSHTLKSMIQLHQHMIIWSNMKS